MGDDERVAIGKVHRKTPPRGYPLHVDPELTPPPSEPPRPESLDGYDRIEPEVRDQLRLLADGLGDVTAAIGKVWNSRNDSARIERLEAKIDGFSKMTTQHAAQLDEFVMPAVKSLMGRVDLLLSGQERRNSQLEQFFEKELPRVERLLDGLAQSLKDLIERLGRLETSKEKLTDNVGSLALRLNAAETRDASLEHRIAALELRNRDSDTGDKREVAITKRQQRLFLAAVAAGSSALSLLVSHFGSIVNFFRK